MRDVYKYARNEQQLEGLIREIEQNGAVAVSGADAGTVGQDASCSIRKVLAGKYVPDEINVQTCLNCKKKRCTGNCKLIKTKKQNKEQHDEKTAI